MQKQGSFIKKKFNKLLICSILTWSAYCLNLMVDSIIGGNQLGETALQAITIVAPIMSVIQFVGYIISPGTGILYGKYIGAFDKEHAYKIAGQGVIVNVILAVTTAVVLLLIKVPFLKYYGCTGELFELASVYYNWVIICAMLNPITCLMYYFNLAEGDGVPLFSGTVSRIVINVVLSYVLCKTMGIAGLGLATFLGNVACTIAYSTHFFKKANSVRLRFYCRFSDIKEAVILSANSSLNRIFIAIVDIVMNKIIIDALGTSYIAAYSVINLILYLFMIPGAAYDACCGMTTVFLGEKNNYGIKNILKTAIKTAFVIGTVIMIVIFFGGSVISQIYGLTSPEIIDASIRAARIMAVSAIPFGIAYFGFNIYCSLNRPGLSITLAFLYNMLCPLLGSVPLTYILGFDGVSVGMSMSSFLVIIFMTLILRCRYGKEGFPLYLKDTGEEVVSFDLKVREDSITEIRDKVKTEFDKHGYEVKRLELLVEELYTRIKEKNPGRTVDSECTLLFSDEYVRIIVRDNGVIFNFVDENNIVESLNAHVLNSLLEETEQKDYVITTSFNRNGFMFEKSLS